jgi:hypothetical protein
MGDIDILNVNVSHFKADNIFAYRFNVLNVFNGKPNPEGRTTDAPNHEN